VSKNNTGKAALRADPAGKYLRIEILIKENTNYFQTQNILKPGNYSVLFD